LTSIENASATGDLSLDRAKATRERELDESRAAREPPLEELVGDLLIRMAPIAEPRTASMTISRAMWARG
jgi:hypothetical protein